VETAAPLNALKLWHVTDGGALEADAVSEAQFFAFSVSIYNVNKLWFRFFTSFDLGEDQGFSPAIK